MHTVLSEIEQRAAISADHPFLRWLADPALPVDVRLASWLPNAAFFVFGFKDLNAIVLRYPAGEAAIDPRKAAINAHLIEDATHWPWYLQDLATLGLDASAPLSEVLRSLFGRDTVAQRTAVYSLCALAGRATDPALRYAAIMALEAVAHRLFAAVLPLAGEFEVSTGRRLAYLGPQHFEREPGHLTHQTDAADTLFHSIELSCEQRASALAIATEVIEVVEARWSEFARVARVRAERLTTTESLLQDTHQSH